ncbi:MAG: hypothetical protein ACXVEF_28680 [Polyangiales bacterium]
MELIDFHGLTRSVQERFVACVRGRQAPQPIAAEKVRSYAPLAWWSVIVLASAALSLYVAWGFGDPRSGHAIHRNGSLGVYGLLVAAITLGIAKLVAIRVRRTSLPFDRGVYVFPMSLVDARDAEIQVYSLADALSVSADPDGRSVRLVFTTGEVFRFRTAEGGDVTAKLESARLAARELRGTSDPRITMMFRLDPLQSPRVSSPLGPRQGLGRPTPRWTAHAWIAAPVAGCVLAIPLLRAHDAASDAQMYRRVTAANDVASYREYLGQGGKRSDYVARVLLPRAELVEAQKLGTVEAIDAFMESHPGSAIEEEVKAAHKLALLADLERAKAIGTVAALQDFAKKWPDHGLEVELRAAIHQLYVPALDAYRKRPPSNAQVASFVDRLFRWSEAKAHAGSAATTIQIRFRRKPSDSLRRADHMVSEHHWFIGEASYPSRYFDASHAMPREKALADVLGKTIRDAFGPAVFTVEQGPRLEDGDAPLPVVSEPTLFVTHTEEWPGRFDGSITKPRGVWIDVGYRFEAMFVIPGDKQPLSFELDVPEKLPTHVIEQNPKGGTPQAPLEDKIYGSMSENAFNAFRDKYLSTLLPTAK